MAQLNGDFRMTFDVDESDSAILSKINHIPTPDGTARTNVTAQIIGSTSYAAKLETVQYGKYRGRDAVLLIWNMRFAFNNETFKRFMSANIKITLEECEDDTVKLPPDSERNPNNDPIVVAWGPNQVCGQVTTVQHRQMWSLETPLTFGLSGVADATIQGARTNEAAFGRDSRMWIVGNTEADDDHNDDNTVCWRMRENRTQKSGILHDFPAFLIATLPNSPSRMVRVSAMVRPYIAFSLNPIRLLQKHDDPTLLDRKTSKGQPIAPGIDFADVDFPLDSIIRIPTEFATELTRAQ